MSSFFVTARAGKRECLSATSTVPLEILESLRSPGGNDVGLTSVHEDIGDPLLRHLRRRRYLHQSGGAPRKNVLRYFTRRERMGAELQARSSHASAARRIGFCICINGLVRGSRLVVAHRRSVIGPSGAVYTGCDYAYEQASLGFHTRCRIRRNTASLGKMESPSRGAESAKPYGISNFSIKPLTA